VSRVPETDLNDKLAIRDVLYRYASGVDRRDWALFRTCFEDEVAIDLSSWNDAPPTRMPADEWVGGVRAGIEGFDVTQHLTANHLIDVQGDEARCTSDVQASHLLDGQRVVLGGWYDTGLRRTPDGWRISASTLHVTWSEGPADLFAEAARRRDAGEGGA